MQALVEADNLVKSYKTASGTVPVLRGATLQMSRGETLALTGESGSGKSTLLHLIGGLDRPDAGHLTVAGQDLARLSEPGLAALRRQRIGFVFQQFNLVASLTIRANIELQSRLAGRHDPARTEALCHRLGLSDHLNKYPEQLSGGQQQRVAIARALAVRPDVILADEPTGNLDETTAALVLDEMLSLVAETDAALLMVTHSTQIAARLSRHLHLRQGYLS